MEKFTIDKRWLPESIFFYCIMVFISILFFHIIVGNYIVGIIIGVVLSIFDYFYSSHYWEFSDYEIKIVYHYRKKTIDFDKKTIKLVKTINPIQEPSGYKIIIRYKNDQLNSGFLRTRLYYRNPNYADFISIKDFALKNNIPMEGDWNKINP